MRFFPRDPFSIRETGVYYSFNADTKQSNWVFIQTSEALREQLRKCFARSNETGTVVQLKIHGVILQTTSDGWRDYLVYLEEKFSELAVYICFAIQSDNMITRSGGSRILCKFQPRVERRPWNYAMVFEIEQGFSKNLELDKGVGCWYWKILRGWETLRGQPRVNTLRL